MQSVAGKTPNLSPGRTALLLLLAFVASAEGQQPKQRPGDPQSTYEPRSQPGAGQKYLEKFVGDWDVVKTFYPRSGEPVRQRGECRQTMIHDGRFLQSDFVFQQRDSRTSGQGIIGYETETGKFTSVWTDSRSTRMSLRQSQDKFNGSEIVLWSRSLQENSSDARRSKTVTRLEDDGRTIVHRQYAIGADGKERLMMELIMTRKQAPASSK